MSTIPSLCQIKSCVLKFIYIITVQYHDVLRGSLRWQRVTWRFISMNSEQSQPLILYFYNILYIRIYNIKESYYNNTSYNSIIIRRLFLYFFGSFFFLSPNIDIFLYIIFKSYTMFLKRRLSLALKHIFCATMSSFVPYHIFVPFGIYI